MTIPANATKLKPIEKSVVLKAATEYFNGDELAASVWMEKYALKDNLGNIYERTPDDMHDRICSELYRIECNYPNPMPYSRIVRLIKGFKYLIPQGSPMAGIGNDMQLSSLSNCFVIGDLSDSYGGIAKIDEEQVQLMKRRGGVGHDLSHLRPKNTPVNNSALASTGIVPYMERYSNSTREVAQNGRRGALMLTISIKHPDALDFIDAKLDTTKITGANVSVKITDEFMDAVINNRPFIQQWPIDASNPQITRTIDAAATWKKITDNAWKSAEPGVLFWDTIINESVADCYSGDGFNTVSTNPCFTGDMKLLTADGYKTFRELWVEQGMIEHIDVGGTKSKVINSKGIVDATAVYRTSESNDVFEVTLKNKQSLKVTGNHKWIIIRDGKEVRVQTSDLKVGDRVPLYKANGGYTWGDYDDESYALLAGYLIADGSICDVKNGYVRAIIRLWNGDIESVGDDLQKCMLDIYERETLSTNQNPEYSLDSKTLDGFDYDRSQMCSTVLGRMLIKDGLSVGDKHRIPNSIWSANEATVAAFLRGLFSGDGHVEANYIRKCLSIRLSQSNLGMLRDVQLLLGYFGIKSSVSTMKPAGKKMMNDGKGGMKEYNAKESYRLIIGGRSNCEKYMERVGFLQSHKNDKANDWLHKHPGSNNSAIKYVTLIKSIEYAGQEETFCITEHDSNEVVVNGVRMGNCGEIPLSPYDSCRLMAINLYSYVKDPFTDQARFDMDAFIADVTASQRLMDDMVDLEIEKIERIIAKIKSDPEPYKTKQTELDLWHKILDSCVTGRRTGLGITAEGDMLAALGIRYGSERAIDVCTQIHQELALAAYTSSSILAKERGAFEVYNSDKEHGNPFIDRLTNSDEILADMLAEHGRRNISLLTIAPTGTTSMMAQTSSGIEPAFMISYRRRRKINPGQSTENVCFIDEVGDRWEEYNVFHHKFLDWARINGEDMDNLERCSTDELSAIIERSPYHMATANNIDWVNKVKMQGSIQKWIDHSISVTVNVPAATTKQMVNDIYVAAWRAGCKGCTIYRDGSRSGVLISSDSGDASTLQSLPAKRPEAIDGKILRYQNGPEKWVAFIGLQDGIPYEVFTGPLSEIELPDDVFEGKILKVKPEEGNNVYPFVYNGGTVPDLSVAFNDEYWNYARLVSGILRHGMSLPYVIKIIDGLRMDGGITSWKHGVVRALKQFVQDGAASGDSCPECSDDLVYREGCISCVGCGYSKC